MGNCLRRCISVDCLESEFQPRQFSFELSPSMDLEFLIDPEAHQGPAETLWTRAELDRVRRLSYLPIEIYESREQEAGGNSQDCAICLQDFVAGERIRTLPCKHFFHVDCINEWLMTSFTCPCCRMPM